MINLKKIHFFYLPLVLFLSCKKDYIETKRYNDKIQKIEYKNGRIMKSQTSHNGNIETEFLYKNGIINEIIQFYPNKERQSHSYLLKAPNYFHTTFYYENGKKASEGEGSYFKDKNLFLRNNEWVFYGGNGIPYSILNIVNDGKNEYLKSEIVYDTINKKIEKDKTYDSPVLIVNK